MNKTFKSVVCFLAIFLYCFILSFLLEGIVSFQSLTFRISLMIALPLGTAIYWGYAKSAAQNEKRILFIMPLAAFVSSLIISVIIELFALTAQGEAGMAALIWPMYALLYIGLSLVLSFITAACISVSRAKPRIQTKLKRSIFFLLSIPYFVVIFDMIQKANTHAIDCGRDICSNNDGGLVFTMLVLFSGLAVGFPFLFIRNKNY